VRQRSITGPIILVTIGLLFLLRNVRPDLLNFGVIGQYWPLLLIAAGIIGLIEVLAHAGRGTGLPPRPLGGGWLVWIVLLCIFIGVFGRRNNLRWDRFDSGGVSVFGSDYDYDVNATASAEGVKRVVLDNLRGNLSIKGEDTGDVRVTGRKTVRTFRHNEADRADRESPVRIERQGDQLFIRTAEPRGQRSRITEDLDITLPGDVNLESHGRTGDLSIDDIEGEVSISAGRGDIRLNHIGKDVKIDASRGGLIRAVDLKSNFELQGRGSDIQLENIAGIVTINGEYSGTLEFRALAKPLRFQSSRTEFHAEAVPGSITMDLGDLKMSNVAGPVRFQTSWGRDIEATDITNALDLSVDRGDVEVTATKGPLPKIDIRTRTGDIVLTLPDRAPFELRASTSQGEVENEYGAPLRTETSGRSGSITGQTGTGPEIIAVTDRGTVSVKKG
jgi:DUF4097 and DUF4098 domain-containing protein YvlB